MGAWQPTGRLVGGMEHLRQQQKQRLTAKFLAWQMAKVLCSRPLVIRSYWGISLSFILLFSSRCPCNLNFKPLLNCVSKVNRKSKSRSDSAGNDSNNWQQNKRLSLPSVCVNLWTRPSSVLRLFGSVSKYAHLPPPFPRWKIDVKRFSPSPFKLNC